MFFNLDSQIINKQIKEKKKLNAGMKFNVRKRNKNKIIYMRAV